MVTDENKESDEEIANLLLKVYSFRRKQVVRKKRKLHTKNKSLMHSHMHLKCFCFDEQ